jgi:type IV pilus assembly protein PilE
MNKLPVPLAARAAGFTLIELMVTIVIGAILLSIAIPSYQSQIRKSRRTEARTALLDLATREERYYSVNNTYSQVAADLGYGAGTGQINGMSVGSGYYTVTVNAAAGPPATFSVVATTANTQVKDKRCATFTVDQTGAQSSTDSNAAASNVCWN